jgi:UDP-N-acetyl-D-mannosaminuronic acid transferase (WecB/TagA/CpsF family)
MMATGIVGASANTLDERVTLLERRLTLADKQIQEGRLKLEEETKNRVDAINSEKAARIEGDTQVRKQLEEAVIGGIHLETTGIVWLACGVILSSLSEELACLAKLI